MRTILSKEQALEQLPTLPYAMITRLSEVTVGNAPNSFSFDELIEAHFFGADKEIHMFREQEDWCFACIEDTDSEFLDTKSGLIAGLGKSVTTRKYISYDADGQAYISDMRLVNWEE